MDTPKQVSSFKLPWQIPVSLVAVAVIVFATLKYCNAPAPVQPSAEREFINIDSITKEHTREREEYRDNMIAADIARLRAEDAVKLYEAQLLIDARSIRDLSKLILSKPSTTPKEVACDSLASMNGVYLNRVDSLKAAQIISDSNQNLQLQLAIDAVSDADRAYDAVADQLLRVKAVYDQLRDASRPRVKVMVGISGTWNPLVFGIGPALAVQGKKGWVIHGSYQITNRQPLYQFGYLVPIKFGK